MALLTEGQAIAGASSLYGRVGDCDAFGEAEVFLGREAEGVCVDLRKRAVARGWKLVEDVAVCAARFNREFDDRQAELVLEVDLDNSPRGMYLWGRAVGETV